MEKSIQSQNDSVENMSMDDTPFLSGSERNKIQYSSPIVDPLEFNNSFGRLSSSTPTGVPIQNLSFVQDLSTETPNVTLEEEEILTENTDGDAHDQLKVTKKY